MKNKMTDQAKLEKLLTEFGVEFRNTARSLPDNSSRYMVRCESGTKLVGGDSGCLAYFDFDVDGKFITMSVWK